MAEPDQRRTAFNSDSVPANYQRHLAPCLFEPWAEILLERVGIDPGEHVLDVASGTGVVARLAAARAGEGGRVVASDASGPMLAHAATIPTHEGSAPIEYVEAPVTELPMDDAAFDVVLCQQGMPFFTDRRAAAAEMHRVLGSGGRVGVAVWVAERRLDPFEEYFDALGDAGVEPPFPGAFDAESFKMSEDEVREALRDCGFASLDVSTVELEAVWPDARAAVLGFLGTPFSPAVEQLSPELRDAFYADLERRLEQSAPGEPVRRTTVAVVAVAASL